jgi:hypothetical protein
LAAAAREYHEWRDAWPAQGDLRALAPTLRDVDRWGRSFRYTVVEGGLEIRSAGVDGVFTTADDVVFRASDPNQTVGCGRGRLPAPSFTG